MRLFTWLSVFALGVAATSSAGCNIESCDGDCGISAPSSGATCETYCGRLDVCSSGQGTDFDGCVNTCETRLEEAHDYQATLCACASWSSCADLEQGRCSPSDDGSAGSTAHGGSSSSAGGSTNASGGRESGGATDDGGEPGTCSCDASGGAPEAGSGGASAEAGMSAGGAAGQAPCDSNCECMAGQYCDQGYCRVPG
ncbi:MAG TPA: hypothetical protein VGP93_05590 [Polyangiaceae bacterium]|nr:hypothetical protein [Polyangiaceae bacterium]